VLRGDGGMLCGGDHWFIEKTGDTKKTFVKPSVGALTVVRTHWNKDHDAKKKQRKVKEGKVTSENFLQEWNQLQTAMGRKSWRKHSDMGVINPGGSKM